MFTHQIQSPKDAAQLMRDNMLVKHYAGSISYGTNLPTSDVDFRGVFCADPINVRTPFFTVRECEDATEEDTKLYELAHFMKLCLDCNPNVVETLWVDPKHVVASTDAYQHLRSHRHALLSSKIAFTTSGYALAQLKRIKGHNKWINNPQPVEPPKPYQFHTVVQWFGDEKNLKVDVTKFRDDHILVPYGNSTFGIYPQKGYQLYADNGGWNDQFDLDRRDFKKAPLFIMRTNLEIYKQHKEIHHNYWQWKNNRNEQRSTLEEQFGYDTKHAMHLVRLLRMGQEVLKTGELIVYRPDADELLAIRDGAWSYDDVVKYAESMDNEVRTELYRKTSLRKKPDILLAAQLLMEVQDIVWKSN